MPPSQVLGLQPMLSVRGGKRAVEFYQAAFAAVVTFSFSEDGEAIVARLKVGAAEFWVADESPEHENFAPESVGGSTTRLILIVSDPDAAFARAIAAGGQVVWPVHDEYGWRLGRLRDPFGHHWEVGRPLS